MNRITWDNYPAFDYVNLYRDTVPYTQHNLPTPHAENLISNYYDDSSASNETTYFYMIESFHGTKVHYSKLLEFKSSTASPGMIARMDPLSYETGQLLSENSDSFNFNSTKVFTTTSGDMIGSYLYRNIDNSIIKGNLSRPINRSDFTIELYFAHSFDDSDDYGRILTIGNNFQDGSFIICRNATSNDSVYHDYYDNGYIGNVCSNPIEVTQYLKFIQYTIIRTDGTIRTYVDGVLKDTHESFAPLLNTSLNFGQNGSGSERIKGCFQKARIFDYDIYDTKTNGTASIEQNIQFMWVNHPDPILNPLFQFEIKDNGEVLCTDENFLISDSVRSITKSGYRFLLVFPELTSSCWSNVNITNSDFTFESYVYFLNGHNNNRIFQIGYSSNANCLALYYNDRTLILGITTDTSGVYTPIGMLYIEHGTWNNICLMRRAGIIYLYVNNNLVILDNSRINLEFNYTFVYVGSSETSGNNWNGAFSNFRIYLDAIYTPLNTISTAWMNTPYGADGQQIYFQDFLSSYSELVYGVDTYDLAEPFDITYTVT